MNFNPNGLTPIAKEGVTQLRDIRSRMTESMKGSNEFTVNDVNFKHEVRQLHVKIDAMIDSISAIETSIAMIAHRLGFITPNHPLINYQPIASAPAHVSDYQIKKF